MHHEDPISGHQNTCERIDCTRKWIGNAVQMFRHPPYGHMIKLCVWADPYYITILFAYLEGQRRNHTSLSSDITAFGVIHDLWCFTLKELSENEASGL